MRVGELRKKEGRLAKCGMGERRGSSRACLYLLTVSFTRRSGSPISQGLVRGRHWVQSGQDSLVLWMMSPGLQGTGGKACLVVIWLIRADY